MRLKLTNINIIKEADISLNGLTVIAGENDSGKSTIGKVLFSIIKSLANTQDYSESQRKKTIEKHVTSLYKRLNGSLFKREGGTLFSNSIFPRFQMEFERNLYDADNLSEFLCKHYEYIDSLEIPPRQKALLRQDLDNIKIVLSQSSNPAEILKAEFQSLIEAEFLNHICTVDTDYSSIEFSPESDSESVFLKLSRDAVKQVAGMNLSDISIKDATYIESPLYMHLLDILSNTITYREVERRQFLMRTMVPFHIKDISQKMDACRYAQLTLFSDKHTIDAITGGRFVYDAKTRSYFWVKDGVKYSPINVASGAKTFGIIQLLLEADIINENKILIWDEPENHLHPQWQISFAQLLVELSNAGIPILVSSHSPYFIQAIRYFSGKNKLGKYVNYYLAEKTSDGLAHLTEVTDDLNRIFIKLAQPMNDIMNIED